MPKRPAILQVLILIGRPASGKSEIIDFLLGIPDEERRLRFHLGSLDVLDDFPFLWTWFEEDLLLEARLEKPHLYTDAQGYFKKPYLGSLLAERLNLEYHKGLRNHLVPGQEVSTVIEFSRGSEHGGYREAFLHLEKDLLSRAAILYVNVPFEESLRKNRKRANPDGPDSLLEHSLPDDKLLRLYRQDDWAEVISGCTERVKVRDLMVPFDIFENADDLTTDQGDQLAERLERCLTELWRNRPDPPRACSARQPGLA